MEKLRAAGEYEDLLKLLKALAKKQVSRELLTQTLIGKSITNISKLNAVIAPPESENSIKLVREESDKLLKLWKSLIKSQEKPATAVVATATPADKPNGIYIPPTLVIKTGDSNRDLMIKKFIEILQAKQLNQEEHQLDTLEYLASYAVEMEKFMHLTYRDYKQYTDKARTLFYNLRDPRNLRIRQKILE